MHAVVLLALVLSVEWLLRRADRMEARRKFKEFQRDSGILHDLFSMKHLKHNFSGIKGKVFIDFQNISLRLWTETHRRPFSFNTLIYIDINNYQQHYQLCCGKKTLPI